MDTNVLRKDKMQMAVISKLVMIRSLVGGEYTNQTFRDKKFIFY